MTDLADALGDDDRMSVAVAPQHRHLPSFAEADVVEWEPGGETVRYRPVDVIEDVLAALDKAVD